MDYTTDKVQLNPECQQRRCRVCYQSSLPLISLCQCSGSIAFVHEECILDWITKKMETSQIVQIPSCEICQSQYSARMKIGTKKICYSLLFQKIKAMRLTQLFTTLFILIGIFLAIYLILASTYSILAISVNNFFQIVFLHYVFPLHFIKSSLKHLKKRKRIFQESVIQIVEVTLLPKISIK